MNGNRMIGFGALALSMALASLLTTGGWECRQEATVQVPASPPTTPAEPVLSAARSVQGPTTSAQAVRSAAGRLTLPDGTVVPALNGVTDPPPMNWAREVPFARIVDTRRAVWPGLGELEWYVHADGTQTTTLVTGAGGSRREAVTVVAHPGPADLVPQRYELAGASPIADQADQAPRGSAMRWVR